MIDFIVDLDKQGTVKTVKWTSESDQIYQRKSIYELFDNRSASKLMAEIENVEENINKQENNRDSITLHLKNEDDVIPLSLYIFPSFEKDLYTAVGISGQTKEPEIVKELINDYNEVVNKMRSEVKKRISQSEEAVRERLEELQKLNNEINNKRRQIEKANVNLNNLNRELSNKLTKDQLTGLVGRYHYWTGIETMIENEPDKQGLFVFIDIDDFKVINDTYGHVTGDEFLKEFANRLQALPIGNALKIRVSGDEFALYIHGLDEVSDCDLQSYWEMIEAYVLKEPIQFNGMDLPVSISVGMSVYGFDTSCVKKLIEYADFAMYRAKERGKKGYYRFQMSEYEEQNNQELGSKAVEQIISQHDLYHVYQPIVSAVDGSTFAYAALMRTNNKYFQSTTELIQTAFKESRYMELDAVSFTKLMKEHSFTDDELASAKLFVPHGPYPLHRNKAIMQANLPEQMVLEIMNAQMVSLEDMEEIQQTAAELNYQVAISNFGDGSTNSLSLLASAPQFLKLNKELIRDIAQDSKKQKLLESIIRYAHSQDSKVIAEGIESKEEMDTVISLQADYLQGFYIGEPRQHI